MGSGHDGVATELAARLAAEGADTEIMDVLRMLPLRLGPALRRGYRWMILHAPWLYDVIYQVFFVGKRAGGTSPLTALAAPRLRRLVAARAPDEVVSTFHLAAQLTGRLRERGGLPCPSTVLVTDFAVHRLWLHRGNDLYLCPNPGVIGEIAARTGRPALHCAPVVRPEFARAGAFSGGMAGSGAAAGAGGVPGSGGAAGSDSGERFVLVSGGSWGVGEVIATARTLARSGRYTPLVLCGDNTGLRRRLRAAGLGPGLGWRDDVPELMAAAYALVDNGCGLTCEEAFAAGLPVVIHRPISGHGRDGARAMARAGVSLHTVTASALLAALDLLRDGRSGQGQAGRAAALFSAMPAEAGLISAPRASRYGSG
ncbi:UDP-N-acetylglucosamine:LPS N-acetylglucosamine transferase [Nonomuraea jiangxiensis]|uniref:UDP-N-acetylglucosamine:LPS N-acetylglucosamine transferase n=2 Tax=Nonomuraea jiangxiensis TaxID=633440 RepID=A0A1G8A2J8_9ACTN|nr:UDP-N-acetylglucosamine:LPS N-acetylglucosamine transferase [Nonomuraea jiangxiensis]